MAYCLPRKNTVKTIFRGSCYKVVIKPEKTHHYRLLNFVNSYVVNKYLWNEIMDFHPRQEPWDLALLTKNWCTNLANIRLPFLEEITFGGTVQLAKCKTAENGLLPSAESIKLEREYEMKRLTKLKCQENVYKEIQSSLRKGKAGLRRPLQPK